MKAEFASEADMCSAFISALPKDWIAYPETGGFDIMLARPADGFQIGIEAKLRLNAKVICQAAEDISRYSVSAPGPDCRAVLIPRGVSEDLAGICRLLGITIIRITPGEPQYRVDPHFYPSLPGKWDSGDWHEFCPLRRIELPNWVPDVAAGKSAPVSLTPWKVKAIKLQITLARRGYLTRRDFAFLDISMSMWTQRHWLVKAGDGRWTAGPNLRDLSAQHPTNFRQIEADYAKWRQPRDHSDIV